MAQKSFAPHNILPHLSKVGMTAPKIKIPTGAKPKIHAAKSPNPGLPDMNKPSKLFPPASKPTPIATPTLSDGDLTKALKKGTL